MSTLKIISLAVLLAFLSVACEKTVCIQCSYTSGGIVNDSGEICTDEAGADAIEVDWKEAASTAGSNASCQRS